MSRRCFDTSSFCDVAIAAFRPPRRRSHRRLVAAAIAVGATVIVTNDRRLRREIKGAQLQRRAVGLDAFVLELWQECPGQIDAVIDASVANRRNPPVTRPELTETLRGTMPSLVQHLSSTPRP